VIQDFVYGAVLGGGIPFKRWTEHNTFQGGRVIAGCIYGHEAHTQTDKHIDIDRQAHLVE
jgi:hypothetical protein